LDSGSGGYVQVGSLLLGAVTATQSEHAVVRATCYESGSRGIAYAILEEVWDLTTQTRVATVASIGTRFQFTSPNQYELALEVDEHSGLGSTLAFATIDITHVRYVSS
jgi:hypothetical protein